MDHSTIKLSDFSTHLSSGDLARVLRTKVQSGKITFDFSGVETVSDVFLNELFGRLLETYGEKIFHDHVAWTGLSVGHQKLLGDVLSRHNTKR